MRALTVFLAIAWMGGAHAAEPGILNVRDFGAKGDGIADDTAAVQATADELARRVQAIPRPWNAGFPEVVFPAGTYLISKTIVWGRGREGADPAQNRGFPSGDILRKGAGVAFLHGEPGAVIRQAVRSQDVFYFAMARRIVVEGLTLEGGRRSLDFWTGNQDVCCPVIRDCRFVDSGDYAIQSVLRKTGTGKRMGSHTPGEEDVLLGYLKPGPDGLLADVDDPSLPIFYHSTYLHVTRCEFVRCLRVLFTGCDINAMDHCRIETSPEMTGAAIRNLGMLRLDDIDGLAHVRAGKDQRWIDNDDGTTVWTIGSRLRLKTEGGAGMCVVHSLVGFRLSTQLNPDSIVLRDSEFDVAGCPENAVVYCKEVPNIVAITNCRQTGAAPVAAVALDPEPRKDAAYFAQVLHPGNRAIVDGGLAYVVDPANQGITADLPEAMRRYRRAPLPAAVARRVADVSDAARDGFPTAAALAEEFPRKVDARACGAKGDGLADDTAAVQRAFDQANDGKSEVVFPGGVYRITGEVTLPPAFSVRGRGNAAFIGPDGGAARFSIPDARTVAFADCSFDSFRDGVKIAVGPGAPARIAFDDCVFNNIAGTAVACRSAAPGLAGRAATRLTLADCTYWNNFRTLDSNVAAWVHDGWLAPFFYAFRNSDGISNRTWEDWKWAPTSRPLAPGTPFEIAAVRNEGSLRIENICGVPSALSLKEHNRWIENAGTLVCEFFRFGGETGGMLPLVVDPAPGVPSVSIVGESWIHRNAGAYYYPNDSEAPQYKPGSVEVRGVPDLLVLRNNVGNEASYPPISVIGETVQTAPALPIGALDGRLFFSGNELPETVGVLSPLVAAAPPKPSLAAPAPAP